MPTDPHSNNHSVQRDESRRIDELGIVILCGGQSTRLGIDKASLKIGRTTFIEQLAHRLARLSSRVLLVGLKHPNQYNLPPEAEVLQDQYPGRGPLEGIRVGLSTLANASDAKEFAFVTSCDVPLLRLELVEFLYGNIGSAPAIVPVENERVFGMTAIYRTDLHQAIDARIARGELRVSDLATALQANIVPVADLLPVDAALDSLTNINSAEDYLALLAKLGEACPPQVLAQLNRQHNR